MATVLITGGTGLIGKALTKELQAKGYSVIILTRNKKNQSSDIQFAEWNIEKGTMDIAALQEADYVVHLAGANVAEKRWTEKRKKEIRESRTKSSALIVQSLQHHSNKVQAVISASAIGWYGPDPQIPNPRPFREEDPPENDFLGQTCLGWEESIRTVEKLGKRLVILRTGIVLSTEGGAYKEFTNPTRFGVAPVPGSGKQIISWIHIDDLVRLYVYAIENNRMRGVYNAVAPNPVSNRTLMKSISENKGFSLRMPVPEFVLKIMLGEMSIEVLKSTTASAAKTIQQGFSFLYPDIEKAVQQLNQKAS